MKIILGTTTLAGAEPAENPQGFTFNGQRVTQLATFLRGTSAKPLARGNVSCTITFQVTRLHDTIQEAEEFVIDHDLKVPNSGVLKLEAADDSRTTVRYAAQCVVASVGVTYDGSNTVTSYTLLTSRLQPNKP